MTQPIHGASHATRGLVAFSIGEFWFGARIEEVAGVIDAEGVAAIPDAPPGLEGVVAFRGDVIPVLDLAAHLGASASSGGGPRCGIVLARGADRVALLVPSMPRLHHAQEIQRAEVSSEGDPEMVALIDSIYRAGDTLVHCLHYWSIADAVVPMGGGVAPGANR